MDLRLGNFRDVLADVTDVDLVFTDPPYPREFLPLWSDLGAWAVTALRPGGLLVAYSGQSYLPEVMSRLGEYLPYVWCGAMLATGSSQVVWRNGFSKPPFNVRTKWKPVLIYCKPSEGGMRSVPTDLFLGSKKTGALHEWEQHAEPARAVVRQLSREGDLVVDPFLGSGTFGMVAEQEGRRFIGAEVDPVAYTTAVDRLAELA